MPTASRMTAALLLALLAALVAQALVVPALPEWRAPGGLVPVATAVAALTGWRLFRPVTTPRSTANAVSLGITSMAICAAVTVLALTFWLALRGAMRGRYHGLGDAFAGWVDLAWREAAPLWSPAVIGALVLGGAATGLIATTVARHAR